MTIGFSLASTAAAAISSRGEQPDQALGHHAHRLQKAIDLLGSLACIACFGPAPNASVHGPLVAGGTQVRAIVEPPFHVIRSLFGSRKVSYRGIAKNAVRAKAYAAPANLYLARRRLAAAGHVCVRNMTGGGNCLETPRERPESAFCVAIRAS